MMEEAYDGVCSFAGVVGFIYKIVHLPGYCFTTDTEQVNFLWAEEVQRPWLKRIVWICDVLSKIEGEVAAMVDGEVKVRE